MSYDAICILSGGLTPAGQPTPWVCARLDQAAHIYKEFGETKLMPLGAGTPYKPPPLDADGFPVFEATASALYLLQNYGIPAKNILPETCSYSTIGSAAFARWILTEPDPDIRNLLVITSEFHMPRTRLFFDWVFSLRPLDRPYKLTYETVKNVGLSADVLRARAEKEQASIDHFKPIIGRITTAKELHNYLVTEYPVYAASRWLQPRPTISESGAKSY